MKRMIACCGLVCTGCPAYLATQADDRAALERVAAHWREAFNMPDITADSVMCDGCLTHNGRLSGYCVQCKVRPCGIEQGVVNCAHCPDYACEKLEAFFGIAPGARTTLDEIRRTL
jgi:hypothetical protein